jgi:hypothetical protein
MELQLVHTHFWAPRSHEIPVLRLSFVQPVRSSLESRISVNGRIIGPRTPLTVGVRMGAKSPAHIILSRIQGKFQNKDMSGER